MSSKRDSVESFLSTTDAAIQSARESLQNIRRVSTSSDLGLDEESMEKAWDLSYLKDQFKIKDLDTLFGRYSTRINQAYFSLFLILLFILSTFHFFIVFICNLYFKSLKTVIIDLICYGILAVLSVVTITLNETYCFNKSRKYTIGLSSIMFSLVFVINLIIPLYNYVQFTETLRWTYTALLVLSTYLFFNITSGIVAFAIGFLVSICELVYNIIIVYDVINTSDNDVWKRIVSEAIFLACLNVAGIYLRIMNEIVHRRTFLDRRACVMSTLKLKYEEEQEDQLMLSIIPKYIIEEVRADIMNTINFIEKSSRLPRQKPFDNPYINTYDNVSILYADIVNYTAMTCTLKPVTKLVETLNELFGSFDDASERLNVLRIKFLGDCYYCVAGLPPNPAPNHAEACVDLGLEMIRIIRNVKEASGIPVDMRIGVNSGKVLSGLIGLTKWQFDVWSNDVLIANKMESTGEAGKVHITKQTKELLTKPYNITVSDKGRTSPELKPFNLETYLVSPDADNGARKLSTIFDENYVEVGDFRSFLERSRLSRQTNSINSKASFSMSRSPSTISNGTSYSSDDYYVTYFRRESSRKTEAPVLRRASGLTLQKIPILMGERRSTLGEVKRRTAFMNTYIKKYTEHLESTHISLEEAIEKMPLRKYEQWFKTKEIHPFLLAFRNSKMELNFFKQPDPLFKYAIVVQMFLILCCTIIQKFALEEWQWVHLMNYITLGFLLCIVTPVVWFQSIWQRYFEDVELGTQPRNAFGRFMLKASERITNNWMLRTLIYVITTGFCVLCVIVELIHCREYNASLEAPHVLLENFDAMIANPLRPCNTPWEMAKAMLIIIIIIFVFLKIYIWLKLGLAIVVIGFYAYNILANGNEYFKLTETFNHNVPANVSLVFALFILGLTLHFIDRQSDYLNRLDYNWNQQLVSEKERVNIMHKINNMLLKNILPLHVAELYLDINRKTDELFHEEYENVAVMFASVVGFYFDNVPQTKVLEIMNRLIGDFDRLLLSQNGLIEKIKVINWTYMAACGLEPGKRDSSEGSHMYKRIQHDHVVISLLKFAVDMRTVLKKIANELFQPDVKLRIGISHGEVTAGVVGSRKPLYDIWGDAVNMASRMESRGEPGKIQVSRHTAEVIQDEGYACEFRDCIFVKGKGNRVPTYFVSLDENDKLVPLEDGFLDIRL